LNDLFNNQSPPARPKVIRYSSSVVSKSHASPIQHLLCICLIYKVKQKLHRHAGAHCVSQPVMSFAFRLLPHGSLLCPASSFTYCACITLQGFAALNTFHYIPAPFLSATCSPPAALCLCSFLAIKFRALNPAVWQRNRFEIIGICQTPPVFKALPNPLRSKVVFSSY
jgi:hypothetical protein